MKQETCICVTDSRLLLTYKHAPVVTRGGAWAAHQQPPSNPVLSGPFQSLFILFMFVSSSRRSVFFSLPLSVPLLHSKLGFAS